MEALLDFWAAYGSTVTFSIVNAFFAFSTYAVLSAGVLSFTTVTFAAVGGFLAANVVGHWGLSIYTAFFLSAVGGGLASAIAAALFLRLESHWMALASLALVLITRVVVLNWPGVTGGVYGMVVPASLSQLDLFILLVIVAFIFYRLHNSWYGLTARAVREDAAVASTIGISPFRTQFIAFMISGIVGGLGGAAMAFTLQFISPETYFVGMAFTMLASTVLGGSFHWLGPIVGAFIFTALPATMQAVVPAIEDVAKGIALVLIMVFLPRGLIDPRAVGLRRAAKRREQQESRADGEGTNG